MTTSSLAMRLAAALLLGTLMQPAAAKLAPPQLTDEQKAKAAEAAARTAWTAKVADFQLCQAMDKVAARYHAESKRSGKDVKPAPAAAPLAAPAASAMVAAVALPPCADAGPFVYSPPPVQPKPLEAAGAHSPPETAKGPPSSTVPAAAIAPTKRP